MPFELEVTARAEELVPPHQLVVVSKYAELPWKTSYALHVVLVELLLL